MTYETRDNLSVSTIACNDISFSWCFLHNAYTAYTIWTAYTIFTAYNACTAYTAYTAKIACQCKHFLDW